LLENKALDQFSYTYTDVANKMLRSTKKSIFSILNHNDHFNSRKLDFNQSFSQQGYSESSYHVIWGVNAAHVANDLKFTLSEIYKTLKPGGSIILSETVRARGNQMIQQEFLLNTLEDYWNVKLDKDIRPCHGFMVWQDWVKALEVIGFREVTTIPDMRIVENQYDNCYVALVRGIK
ncbi:MAG: class I SAM-dependent methyltransferase, partial [Spirochaetes bacterium]|nr:class I SAM-dependent methyltransferase [Spirochaetota bacterium]